MLRPYLATANGQTTTFTYDGDGRRVKKVEPSGTTYYPGEHYEVKGGVVTKYYYLGGQRVAMKVGSTVYYLHGDHLGSTSLMTTAGGIHAQQRYFPYGEVRWSSGSLPTDLQFTGQRREASLGIYDYKARFYSPYLGRFLSADTLVPGVGSQHLSRYMYVTGNPLRYRDPTGHVKEDEEKDAQKIIDELKQDYDVTIDVDFGRRWRMSIGPGESSYIWNEGAWQLSELELVLQAVKDLANVMGGGSEFKKNLQGVTIMRAKMSASGMGDAHNVWLNAGKLEKRWTVVHELAHAWDGANRWNLSRSLEKFVGGNTTGLWACFGFGEYDYGKGPPPKGADDFFNRYEDFAESVTTFVYPGEAQAFIRDYFPNTPEFHYDNYYATLRAEYVAGQMNMAPQTLDLWRRLW